MFFSLFLAWLFIASVSAEGKDECLYVAAVYEHVNGYGSEFEGVERMLANLDVYESEVKAAAALGAQIIVFPENGLTGSSWNSSLDSYYQQIPQQFNSSWNPCLQANDSVYTIVPRRLSCMARDNNIIVVANFPSSVSCSSNCSNQTTYHYNTDAVFDVDGHLITKYYKVNLYGEPMFDTPPADSYIAYFDTSFGRFGLITCFDLVWYEPTIQLVEDYEVDSLLFPTAWMDQLPYLTSIQAQSAWANGLNVNLLAANLFLPQKGFMGSGLYSGVNGPVAYVYTNDNVNGTLIVNQLPCYRGQNVSNQNDNGQIEDHSAADSPFHFIKHQNMVKFVGAAMAENDDLIEVCQGTMCCNVSYEYSSYVSNNSSGGYWLVLHQGNISEGNLYNYDGEICSVLWCDNGALSLDTCAANSRPNVTDTFKSLAINSNFTTPFIFPSVLLNDLTLLNNSLWGYSNRNTNGSITASLEINSSDKVVLAATLYARNYALDL